MALTCSIASMATTIVEVLARGYLDGITRGLSFEEARRLLGEPWSEEPPHRTTRVMKWGNLVLGFGARGMFMASLYLWRSQQPGFHETLHSTCSGCMAR
jgi:hypothetical protein